ncbi:MAG: sulfatase, partial [Chitinophagales bacterium]
MLAKMFLLLFLIFSEAFAFAQQRPNIIYIMADDLGYADLSGYGRKNYKTPNLDELATQGVRFINAYAAAPLCTPTRTGFMTGRYPARTPVGLREPLDWSASDSSIGLTRDQTSLPTLLRKNGYETFLVGKWHLG